MQEPDAAEPGPAGQPMAAAVQVPTPEPSLLAHALAAIANAIFITDDASKIVWVNDAFCKLSGYTAQETIGRTPAMLQSGRQDHAFYAQLWRTIRAGQVWQGEIDDARKDGSVYTVDEVITPLHDAEGAVTHFIVIQHDITQRKQQIEREHRLAYHDVLTGLPNRTALREAQQKAISQAQRKRHMLATLFIDLDGFKPVNDSLGHHTGDQLLAAVAERLRGGVRQVDTIARFGGDEFAVLVADLQDGAVAEALARKLLDALAQPFALRGRHVKISASIGIALYPADGEDPETLLMHADKAMYQAKCRGGNHYQLYDPTFSQ
jgi:diguanylate cyclase (GGDEF)-like protein/PAS domain S-box-containing protein